MIFSAKPVRSRLVVRIELQACRDGKIWDAMPLKSWHIATKDLRATEQISQREIQNALQTAWQHFEEHGS